MKRAYIRMLTHTYTADGDMSAGAPARFVPEDTMSITGVPARFSMKQDGFTLAFDEKSEDGTKTATRLDYESQTRILTLSRYGSVRYTATFEMGKTCSFVYAVPPFSFDAAAETEGLDVRIDEAGGALTLAYRLAVNDVLRRIDIRLEVTLDDKGCGTEERNTPE